MKPSPVSVPSDLVMQLSAARRAQGLSQVALAKRLGTRQAQISRVETGLIDPQLSTVQNLAGALDLGLVLVPRPLCLQMSGRNIRKPWSLVTGLPSSQTHSIICCILLHHRVVPIVAYRPLDPSAMRGHSVANRRNRSVDS